VTRPGRVGLAACLLSAPLLGVIAQNPQCGEPPAPATLGLEQGTLEFDTPDFTLRILRPHCHRQRRFRIGAYRPLEKFPSERGALTVSLQNKVTWIELSN
jgi:hypothetical protein